MLLPALSKAREASKTTVCLAHLQQINASMGMYVNDYRGWPCVYYPPLPPDIPYGLGYHDLLARYSKTLGWTPGYKYTAYPVPGGFGPMVRLPWSLIQRTIFACPSDDNASGISVCGSYSYNIGLIWTMGSPTWDTGNHWRPTWGYKDQANTALMVCGGGTSFNSLRVIWYYGQIQARRLDSAAAYHNKGTTILFCDGHAQWAPVDLTNPEYFGGFFTGYRFDPSVRVWPVNLVWDPFGPVPPMPRPPY
jgi:prepilin-type processing-associated H-X9-DG protein